VSGEALDRAAAAIAALREAEIIARTPLTVTAAAVGGEPIPYDAALRLPFAPVAVGAAWGAPWDTWWFRFTGAVPDAPTVGEASVVVTIDLGCDSTGFGAEGLAYRGGVPVQGLAGRHRELRWAEQAAPGAAVEVVVEAAANPQAWVAGRAAEALPTGVQSGPLLWTLRQADIGVLRPDVRRLAHDLSVLRDLAAVSADWLPALDKVLDELDVSRLGATLDAALAQAAAVGRAGDPRRSQLYAVGNSHIDSAWLWPIRETRRKIARTVASLLAYMDEHDGYRFAVSQPQQLAWLREDHPSLFARLGERVAEGRVLPVGAMWVEPDCNMPSGESLIRQMVHGQRFWRDAFGVEATEVWLPDVFGYPATLPSLMHGAGIRRFLTQKMSWNETNRIPRTSFWWEGPDGARVLAHLPPADTYTGTTGSDQLAAAGQRLTEHGQQIGLYLYGYGDGGGGPTRSHIERLHRLADVDALPRVQTGVSVAEFWSALEEQAESLPDWVGELYLEKHRGTLTTQARLKAANRRLEGELRELELWSCASDLAAYPTDDLHHLWSELLLHQFHDMLPGSSIAWVHADTAAAYERMTSRCSTLRDAAMRRLVGSGDVQMVVNASPFARAEVAEADGQPIWVEVPALAASPVQHSHAPAPVVVGRDHMDNGVLRVAWDANGCITSVVDQRCGRELVRAGRRLGVLQLLDDRPAQWDAWDVDAWTMATAHDVRSADAVEVVESGPLRAVLEVRRRTGASTFTQRVTLAAGSARLDFQTVVDWQEQHTMLKIAFPVDVQSRLLSAEIQYGAVDRPIHANTSWDAARFEVCAHRWVDLRESDFGVAVLNDGRYGHDVCGGAVRVSLLRSPTWPDATADRGRHCVNVALLPHDGTRLPVLREAWSLNTPLRMLPGSGSAVAPLITVDDDRVVVAAVKRAEDGSGVVVRLHEAVGGRRRVRLRTRLPFNRLQPVDHLERPLEEACPLDDAVITMGAHEVRSFLLAR